MKLSNRQIIGLNETVTATMKAESIPGLVAGISQHGELLLARGYGLADVERGIPVDPTMIFQIGSIGKSFVSAAIMMLVENNELSLDDSICDYFRDAPENWRGIKIKHLLSHTSGLPEYIGDSIRTDSSVPLLATRDYTENEIVSTIMSLPVEFEPGERYSYINTNYMLLGVIIERITGRYYFDFLRDRIFKPLGMDSVRQVLHNTLIRNKPCGYELRNGRLENAGFVSDTFNSTADGTLYCNVSDLAKWDGALYKGGLLKRSLLDTIFTVFKLNDGKPNKGGYGFGWFIKESGGHRLIEHTGNWNGFTSVMSRYVDDGLSVIILCNLGLDVSEKLAVLAHSVSDLIIH